MKNKLWILFLIFTNALMAVFDFHVGNMWSSGFSSACAATIAIFYIMDRVSE